MTNEAPTSNWNIQHGRTPVLAFICIVALLCCAVGYVCVVRYEEAKKNILDSQKNLLQTQAERRVQNLSLWFTNLGEQVKRVSSSELYRLFASEASQMSAQTNALLNEADGISSQMPEDISALAEQVPLMRNVMLDFMNYNGFIDTRLVNAKGQTLLSAITRPTPIDAEQHKAVTQAITSGKITYAPMRSSAAGLVLDVLDPVGSILDNAEAQNGNAKPVAALLVTVPASGSVARALMLESWQRNQLTTHLLQKNANIFEVVQMSDVVPVAATIDVSAKDASIPFAKRTALNGSTDVYSYGQPTAISGWWVVMERPADEVYKQLDAAALQIFGLGGLLAAGLILLFALLWRIVIGRQQQAVAEHFQQLYAVINQQKKLLDSVNLSLDIALFMADNEGNIQVCNQAFANLVQSNEEAILGTNLTRHMPLDVFKTLLGAIRAVGKSQESSSLELAWPDETGNERLFRVTLYPFDDKEGNQQGAVGTLSDITEFRRRSERQQRQQRSLIEAFTRAVEGVDPYLAGHSYKMGELALLIAKQLKLSEQDCNTVHLAAALSQVGKLFVPRDLLTKSGKLTPEEQEEMSRVPGYTKKLLGDIDFGLPVVEAIYEMYEHMDGSGYPQKLSGDAIAIHARILAVANVFCAIASPRSYRSGLPASDAVAQLKSMNERYDQHIVEALKAVLETPEGASVVLRQP